MYVPLTIWNRELARETSKILPKIGEQKQIREAPKAECRKKKKNWVFKVSGTRVRAHVMHVRTGMPNPTHWRACLDKGQGCLDTSHRNSKIWKKMQIEIFQKLVPNHACI
jgi:hypothetical protein